MALYPAHLIAPVLRTAQKLSTPTEIPIASEIESKPILLQLVTLEDVLEEIISQAESPPIETAIDLVMVGVLGSMGGVTGVGVVGMVGIIGIVGVVGMVGVIGLVDVVGGLGVVDVLGIIGVVGKVGIVEVVVGAVGLVDAVEVVDVESPLLPPPPHAVKATEINPIAKILLLVCACPTSRAIVMITP